MSNPIPSSLALSTVSNGTLADASPVENNFAAIQLATNEIIVALGGGTAGQVLSAVDATDVQYVSPNTVSRYLAKGKKTSNATGSGTTFAAGTDILASALTFIADGTSDYLVTVCASGWSSTGTGDQKILWGNLDGAIAGIIAVGNTSTGGYATPLDVDAVIPAPSAGSHTLNVRVGNAAGAVTTINGGAAGANFPPILVAVSVV